MPGRYRHIAYDTTGSTNDDCLQLARYGDTGKVWITAKQQSKGRGTRGRIWQSQTGNLAASLLLIDPAATKYLGTLSLAASIAAIRSIGHFVAPQKHGKLRLKWPNDVLLDGKKICGILLESHVIDMRTVMIIGFGINCASHPIDSDHLAGNIGELGAEISPQALFAQLAVEMDLMLSKWDRGHGFSQVRTEWMRYAHAIGTPMSVRTGETNRQGRFETIDEMGNLVLIDPYGTQQIIPAGDVYLSPQQKVANNEQGSKI